MLDGVNKKCAGCTQDCKQWKQVTIERCPFHEYIDDAKRLEKDIDYTQNKG